MKEKSIPKEDKKKSPQKKRITFSSAHSLSGFVVEAITEKWKSESPRSQPSENAYDKFSNWINKRSNWRTILVCINIGTLAAFIVFGTIQSSKIQETINVAKNNASVELRAYIGIDSLRFNDTISSDKPFKYNILLYNSGQTPAYNISLWNECVFQKMSQRIIDSTDSIKKCGDIAGFRYMGSKQKIQISIFVGVGKFTYDTIELIKQNKLVVNFYGRCEYIDVFGDTNFTQYCFRYDPIGNGFIVDKKYFYTENAK